MSRGFRDANYALWHIVTSEMHAVHKRLHGQPLMCSRTDHIDGEDIPGCSEKAHYYQANGLETRCRAHFVRLSDAHIKE